MIIDNIQRVMGRAITDLEFRKILFQDPDRIIADYKLNDEDADVIRELDREEFDQFAAMFDLGIIQNLKGDEVVEYAAELEERVSRAGLNISSLRYWDPGPGGSKGTFTGPLMAMFPNRTPVCDG